MIQAISLDFWGTIATFNPEYSRARTKLLAEAFGIPEAEADARYKAIKKACDREAEEAGIAMTPLNAVERLVRGTSICPVELLESLEQRARADPPLLHPEVTPLLREIKERGVVIGISSNTNFLAGRLVQSFFDIPWDFTVYSDELGVSKPSPHFFRTAALRAARHTSLYSNAEVIHIGDNAICDFKGAQAVGMKAELVRNPDDTVSFLKAFTPECRYAAA